MTVSTAVAGLVVAIAMHAALAWALQRWGLWVARKHGGGAWRAAYGLPVIAFWLAVIGMAVSSFFLVHTWRLTHAGEAAHKATVLAEGIAATMNLSAAFAALSGALYVAAIVVSLIGTIRR